MKDNLFFNSSRHVVSRITDLYDFIWPTAVAMWNLRWQVNGFHSTIGNASPRDLFNRFSENSNIHGANIHRSCIECTWDEQQEQFARILLIQLCALYEAWIEELFQELRIKNKKLEKGLQFPTNGNKGILWALTILQQKKSNYMEKTIYSALKDSKKYVFSNLDNHLVCYRYFKECRNSIIHSGSKFKESTIDAYSAYVPLSKESINTKEKPIVQDAASMGDEIKVSLRGVVGLSDIIIRIIKTIDTELSKTTKAEEILLTRISKKINPNIKILPTSPAKRKQRVEKIFCNIGLIKPHDATFIIPLFIEHKIFS